MPGQHPSTLAILRYFRWEHLPPHLQGVSRPFADLAHRLAGTLPAGDERDEALRKLLESKDAAVRAALPPDDGPTGGEPALPVFGPPPGSFPVLVGERGPDVVGLPPGATVTVHVDGRLIHEGVQRPSHRPHSV